MINVLVNNIDLGFNDISWILDNTESVINETINSHDWYKSDKIKGIRKLIDSLSMYNMTVTIEGISMVEYDILLGLKHIKFQKEEIYSFNSLQFDDIELSKEYTRLCMKCAELHEMLNVTYGISESEFEYLEPNSRLVKVQFSLSIKEMMELINSCLKYDEMLNMIVAFSNNEIMAKLLSITNLVNGKVNILNRYDLFMRSLIDNETRTDLVNSVELETKLLSNREFIKKQLDQGSYDVKVSTLTTMSYVAYRELMSLFKGFEIKLENPLKLTEYNIGDFPTVLSEINDSDLNEITQYLYDWSLLYKRVIENDPYNIYNISSVKLGCVYNVVYINNRFSSIVKQKHRVENEEAKLILNKIDQSI